jgi:hypothetical protein
LATRRVRGATAAIAISSDQSKGVNIFAASGSPVIAVNDGKVVTVGQNYIRLQDQTGNIYTYSGLGAVARTYAVPKPIRQTPAQLNTTPAAVRAPAVAASAGTQAVLNAVAKALPQAPAAPVAGAVKQRLFAHPGRSASYAAGGAQQLAGEQTQIESFRNYFSSTLHLARNQYTFQPLRAGAIVVAGTVLGRIATATSTLASHLRFQLQPAGTGAPYIDPKPILDGWKLLEATAVYRADRVDPFYGPGAKNPSIGQVLLMSKEQLQQRVLTDPHLHIYPCGERDIAAGLVDRRILAAIEFLAASGLDPTITGLVCGNPSGAAGSSATIAALDGIPIQGHQGNGSITDIAIRRLLTLQGAMQPTEIISLMSYKGQANTLALPDHTDRLQITYTPQYGANKRLTNEIKSALQPTQWINLIQRIGQIPEPVVPITTSKYAIQTHG